MTKRKIALHTLRILLVLIGLYVTLDGVGSIIEYWTQHWYEHAVRVGRIICGLLALWVAWRLREYDILPPRLWLCELRKHSIIPIVGSGYLRCFTCEYRRER